MQPKNCGQTDRRTAFQLYIVYIYIYIYIYLGLSLPKLVSGDVTHITAGVALKDVSVCTMKHYQ